MRRLVSLALLCVASPLAAQTSDPIFARWRWNPDSIGSRPAGVGGAFVAIADSVMAAYVNPAGLTLIPVRESSISSGGPWLGVASAARGFRLAGYLARTRDTRAEWEGPAAASGVESGFLDSSVWEAGLAVGVEPARRVRLGASLAWSRLDVDGQDLRSGTPDGERQATTLSGGTSEVRVTAGLLIDLVGSRRGSLPSLRMGIDYQPGFDWSANLRHGREPAGGSVAVRRPSLVAVGLAYRPSDRWGFSAQGDFIRYYEVIAALRR